MHLLAQVAAGGRKIFRVDEVKNRANQQELQWRRRCIRILRGELRRAGTVWKVGNETACRYGRAPVFGEQFARLRIHKDEHRNALHAESIGEGGLGAARREWQGEKGHFAVVLLEAGLVAIRRNENNFDLLAGILERSVLGAQSRRKVAARRAVQMGEGVIGDREQDERIRNDVAHTHENLSDGEWHGNFKRTLAWNNRGRKAKDTVLR
jgi:hypothetical protein